MSDSSRPHGLQPTRLLHPRDFPGKSTGVGCHFPLQGDLPTQGLNPGLPHCRQMLYHLSHQENPKYSTVVRCSGCFSHFTWSRAFLPLLQTWYQPGEGNGTPLQYSCLENPLDGGAWWAAVHGLTESRTRLSDFPFTFHFHELEKEMATRSSVLAWRIPGTGEPGGLPSVGSHRVRHD